MTKLLEAENGFFGNLVRLPVANSRLKESDHFITGRTRLRDLGQPSGAQLLQQGRGADRLKPKHLATRTIIGAELQEASQGEVDLALVAVALRDVPRIPEARVGGV